MVEGERVHVEQRAQWRAWLAANAARTQGGWLVSWRVATRRPAVSDDDAVSEVLAFGWVDSKPAELDDERTMLWCSPRRPGSGWSRPDEVRVSVLEREG